MTKTKPPNVPYVEAHNQGSKQRPTAIVLDMSSTTSDKGAALGIANRLHKTNAPANSYHYMVDEAETYRGVWDNVSAYYAPHRSIDILLCAQPQLHADYWEEDSASARALLRTAELVAKLSLIHKIPLRYLEAEAAERWHKHKWRMYGGIIVNFPGEWPSGTFLLYALARREQLACRKAS